jgi:hypothetical protein
MVVVAVAVELLRRVPLAFRLLVLAAQGVQVQI